MEQWYPLSEQKTVFNSEVPQELELRIREDYGLNADIEALYVKYGESVVSAVIKNTRKDVLDSELKTELRRITNNGRDVRPVQDVMKELDKKEQFRNVPTSRVQRIMNASGRVSNVLSSRAEAMIIEEIKEYLESGSTESYILRKVMDDYKVTYDEANMALLKAKKKNSEVEQNGIEDSPEEYVEEMIAEGASRSIIIGHLIEDFGLGETGAGLMYQKALKAKGKKNEEVEQNALYSDYKVGDKVIIRDNSSVYPSMSKMVATDGSTGIITRVFSDGGVNLTVKGEKIQMMLDGVEKV